MKFSLKMGMVFVAAVLGNACQTTPPAKGVPAVLVNPSQGVTEAITKTVSQALGRAQVAIAPGALTESSNLIIELAGRGSLAGNNMMGRRMDRPDHFTLSLNGNKCVLTHEESGESYYLRGAKCKALEAP